MKRIARIASIAFSFFALLVVVPNCSGYDDIFSIRDGKTISFEALIQDLKSARVVFFGEKHDSKKDHRSQLEVIQALHRAGVPLAIGLEMFRADSQRELDEWVKGKLDLGRFLKIYYDNWSLPWPLYKDILLYSRNEKIPVIGLNVPGDITKKVSREGFSSLTEEELKKLPPGISCDIDEQYMDFIRKAYSAHTAEDKSFLHFCEAQMVWDKTMAWHIAEYLKENPGRTVIVLAGVGHSWKKGIPAQMETFFSNLSYRVILPEMPDRVDRSTVVVLDTDYLLVR